MRLVVGLGNPQLKYKNTRHNVGFMVLDAFLKNKKIKLKNKPEFKGEIYVDKDFIFLKPLTYMNLSGQSVNLVKNYYKIDEKDILIISDDFNLPFLKLRLREKGSAGGHNGLKNIIQEIGSSDFNRLRIGLGSPEIETIDFVLSKFSKEELKQLENIYINTNEIIEEFINGKTYDSIMNRFNSNNESF